jgi:hypothetical protein
MRRQAWGAITIKRSKVLMQKLVDVSITVTESIKNIKNVLPSIVF